MNYGQAQRQKPVLEAYIERACDPSRYEPDLALNLEICDVIKEKQKNTPREAAIYIVRLINHKNMHVGMLALVLLDNCVKNCGHPFHLQIATKEFLNALVRKFPERPLAVPTPVQTRILEMIHEWYTTLCKTSRYKDDLVHIRDMHRLLTFKGYRFPQSRRIAESVLNPVDSLKSPAELEEEDRIAQAADQDKPNYSEQTSVELDKLHQKATLLIEMLNDVKPGEIIGRGDIFEDLFGTCKAAHSKVQKFIADKEDPDNMEQLIELDQLLNSVIEQYQQVKNGNFVKVSLPEGSSDSNNQTRKSQEKGVSTPKQTQPSLLDLLDFDGSSNGSSSSTTAKTPGNLMDDLANLNFNDVPSPLSWGATGSISLGQSANNLFDLANPSSPTNGGAPNYNIFASPISSVNPVSVGSTSHISAMPVLQQKPAVQSTASPLDDFEFVSNTGAPAQDAGPISVTLVNKNGFQVDLDIEKQLNPDRTYMIKAYFSNHQNNPLTSLTFRVAVPRTLQLKLDPQSAQVVPPFSQKTVTQEMTVQVPANVAVVRMRYHVSYVTGGRTIEEQGEFSQFP
ncbi:hypothetical protein BGX34_004854 [Mortierella sp. NVP85]|nr:hypothetical protein BGX34_004854 [Mortierella sp. NVP85]